MKFLKLTMLVIIGSASYIVYDFINNSPTFNKVELTMEEEAYLQYDKGYRSTVLPDSPLPDWKATKGDEYKYCIEQGWGKNHPDGEVKFCAWHAELGIWQIRG
tara:strand:- start:356 stop:664 length:309 start_codon:yes stop_codon:yes gene_type:complete